MQPSSRDSVEDARSVIPITRLDLLTAALLVCLGITSWHISEDITVYLLAGKAPEREEFTGANPVRAKESLLKTTQVEVDAIRAKLVEQHLGSDLGKLSLDQRIQSLEQTIATQEQKIANLRKTKSAPQTGLQELESDLKMSNAELEATRTKVVEQRVLASVPQVGWTDRLSQLETVLYSREHDLFEARRRANQEFEHAAFEFKAIEQTTVLVIAAVSAWILFWSFPGIAKPAGKRFDLMPDWRRVRTSAASILAFYYAFMIAGPAISIGVGAVTLIWLLRR